MITRMVCTTAIPAVQALQVKAGAEGRAEGGERQEADGQRIGADMLDQLPRHQRAQRYPEQHQHCLGQQRRHGERSSGQRRDADRHHRAGYQPARQTCPQKQQAARGADGQRFERDEKLGAVGKGRCDRCRDQVHAILWQIRASGTNALTRCSNARRVLIVRVLLPSPPGEGETREVNYFPGLSALAALALHSERNFLRSLPWRPLASASFEHSSEAAVCGFSAFFSAGALVSALGASVFAAGAVVCAEAAPISSSEAKAVAVAKAEILVMGHLGWKQGRNRRAAMLNRK
jgi:hypothetical protein